MAHPTMQEVEAAPETKLLEVPEHERIALRAYALWKSRGRPEGSPDVDWLEAEQEEPTVSR